MQNYHPLHLGDLGKSGLSPATINEAGIKTIMPKNINKLLGFNIPSPSSMYAIPFLDIYG